MAQFAIKTAEGQVTAIAELNVYAIAEVIKPKDAEAIATARPLAACGAEQNRFGRVRGRWIHRGDSGHGTAAHIFFSELVGSIYTAYD
ncbi:hypothetical protein [Mycobacterium uberis]|uniref:hypothetical protein n=1 Tax=Mycobacterium uberis TaxID=2162698 RepID=UPI000E3090E5|nr:hypothetical protein [Mycobacterium uberis]